MEEVRKHITDKPVRYGVLTHHHSDHVPGAADYAAEGATIITFRENETVVRNAAGNDEAKLEFVENRMSLSDGERTIELYDIGPTPHAEALAELELNLDKIVGAHSPRIGSPAELKTLVESASATTAGAP